MQDAQIATNDHNVPNFPIELILEKAQEAIVVIQNGRHKYVNKRAAEITGYSVEEMRNKHLKDTIHREDYDKVISSNMARLRGNALKYRHRIFDKNGQLKHLESFGTGISWEGKPATLCFVTDITAQINAENELREKSVILEQTNTALNVLLKHREKDLRTVEENIVSNIKELVLPYVENLKVLHLSPDTAANVDIIEKHLNEVLSPFLAKLTHRYCNLTPREIQIAALIKDGKTTKEICKILNIAAHTVDNHRKNVRRKLGLESREMNLRSFLMSLCENSHIE